MQRYAWYGCHNFCNLLRSVLIYHSDVAANISKVQLKSQSIHMNKEWMLAIFGCFCFTSVEFIMATVNYLRPIQVINNQYLKCFNKWLNCKYLTYIITCLYFFLSPSIHWYLSIHLVLLISTTSQLMCRLTHSMRTKRCRKVEIKYSQQL